MSIKIILTSAVEMKEVFDPLNFSATNRNRTSEDYESVMQDLQLISMELSLRKNEQVSIHRLPIIPLIKNMQDIDFAALKKGGIPAVHVFDNYFYLPRQLVVGIDKKFPTMAIHNILGRVAKHSGLTNADPIYFKDTPGKLYYWYRDANIIAKLSKFGIRVLDKYIIASTGSIDGPKKTFKSKKKQNIKFLEYLSNAAASGFISDRGRDKDDLLAIAFHRLEATEHELESLEKLSESDLRHKLRAILRELVTKSEEEAKEKAKEKELLDRITKKIEGDAGDEDTEALDKFTGNFV